ncbi:MULTISPECIES: MarR family winged helix-turn-helix transcriptional regulator [Paraburkholderia]|jgi:DNA-binding MarR family transcriptional regulator|uniref:DNA-binding transcriptional regulator, MarR family n=1 Tax=Paraburkholderia phenazinium TaxID=60549 RepID=A0A1N6JMR8_9BURK|nr:MarR family transcriptional regulator [Paraburkholderia phenazinium]SDG14914.1 DNA-binding transcriptional regulator, MarR family [Paraburkholderia phenazinium]SIO45625.1 DNA-binding transcriptional regulator, MarR family [Paraburkholderia phenazinium]
MSTKPTADNINDDLVGQVDQSELLDLLGYNVRRAYLVIQAHFDMQMEKLEVRQADFAVLSTLRRNPGINQKSLAEALAIAPPNLATLLDRLESAGLLARQRSTGDKRIQLVSLTPQGTKLHTQAVKAARKADEAAVHRLSSDERDQLRLLLSKIFQD